MSSGEEIQELPLPLGQVVAGKYRIDGVVGRGGMGVVYVATDLTLDRRVAMKVITSRASSRSA